MNPYELTQIDGSVEYRNLEPGIAWLTRIFEHYRRVIWWNPEPAGSWEYTRTTQMILHALGPRRLASPRASPRRFASSRLCLSRVLRATSRSWRTGKAPTVMP